MNARDKKIREYQAKGYSTKHIKYLMTKWDFAQKRIAKEKAK